MQGVPRRDGGEGGRAVHGGSEGMDAALVGQGAVPLGAPAVRGERQRRGILHPRIGGVLQPEEEGERAPAPPPRHGARPRGGGLHDRDDHAAPPALAGRHGAGAGTPGLVLRARVRRPQDTAQDRLCAQRGRVGRAKADVPPVEGGRASGALLGSAVRRGGGGRGGGLGRRRRGGEEVLQPDVSVETRVLQVRREDLRAGSKAWVRLTGLTWEYRCESRASTVKKRSQNTSFGLYKEPSPLQEKTKWGRQRGRAGPEEAVGKWPKTMGP